LQGASQIAVGDGRIRHKTNRQPKVGRRILQLAHCLERVAEVAVRVGVIRFDGQGAFTGGRRFRQLPRHAENAAQIAVRLSEVRIFSQGRANAIDGRAVLAHLMGEQAQQVQGAGMTRFGLQDLPVEPLRLAQIARLMLLHGKVQNCRRIHGHINSPISRHRN
jgi:hypothetical protein